jgi:hypothetical protein
MVNYANAKIYRIYSPKHHRIYIGSTCKKLIDRLRGHRYNYRQWQEYKYAHVTNFELMMFKDVKIELLEAFPCKSRKELLVREGFWIQNTTHCLNKYVVGRTRNEQYKLGGKAKIIQYQQTDKYKKYLIASRDMRIERSTRQHICACGSMIRYGGKYNHERSKKHIAFKNNLLQ